MSPGPQDPEPGEQARWQSGPDPDAPPWAGRRRDAEESARDDEGAEPTQEPTQEPDREPGGEAEDDSPSGAAAARPRTDDDAPPERTKLARMAPGMQPPRPPRRTGVFVDPDDLRDYVGGLLRAILGGYEVDAFGNFTFQHEGARVFVTVGPSPIGPQVGVFSVTNLGLELTDDLGRFLLTTNHRLGFGSFSYDLQNKAVWLRHALLGTTLDGPELQAAVAAIAQTAAAFDHEIRDQFGGHTFGEAPTDEQQRVEPPEPSQSPGGAGGYL